MLIITGTVAYDYIMDFPGKFADHILPNNLHKINLSFIVNNFEKRRGGTAGNVSYNLALLQTRNVLFSYGGHDLLDYAKQMEKAGVDVSNILIDPAKFTATGFAMTDKDDNQIWGYFYGAADNIVRLKLKRVAKKGDLILVGPSGAKGSISFVHQCVEMGTPYMFDPGFILTQVSDDDLEFGVKFARFIIGNDYEINLIKERIKNWRQYFAKKTIITTLGEKGSIIEDSGKIYKIGPVKPNKVADPTGAGDAWRAGFLAGLERGFDLKICGQMGAVCASYAVEKYGTQEHKFTVAEFKKRYKENFRSVLKL